MTEHPFLLPVAGQEWALSSTLLQTPCLLLPLASSHSCVWTPSTAWCCCGSQVWIMDGKLQSPALLKALETSTEHQVTGSGVNSCCFDAASQKENLFGPCSLRSFLFMWNIYLCSLQELCTPLGCRGISLGYQRQCWWSQSSFSASLQVCLAQHWILVWKLCGHIRRTKQLRPLLHWWIRGCDCLQQEQLVWHQVMYFLCHTSLSYLLVGVLDIPGEGKMSICVAGLRAVRPGEQGISLNQITVNRLANYNLLTFAPPVSNHLIS